MSEPAGKFYICIACAYGSCGSCDEGLCSCDHGETEAERVERFRPQNDSLWGPDGWVMCEQCPPDHFDKPVFHSKEAHA